MKRKKLIMLFGFITLFMLMILLFAGRWLVNEDVIEPGIDATVILMGSIEDRAKQAIDLFTEENVSGKILIAETGVEGKIYDECFEEYIPSNSVHTRDMLIKGGIASDSIFLLGKNASRTIEEAEIICGYIINDPHIKSIVIVSSPEHLRRASIIFTHLLKKSKVNVEVYCSPSKYSGFDMKHWWKNRNNIKRVVYEYVKILNYYLSDRHRDFPVPDDK